MSVEYTYDEEQNVLYTRFFGVITAGDLKRQAENVCADPRICQGVRELVDLSDIEEIDGSESALEQNIRIDREHSEKLAGLRTAIVAPTDLLYGFARVYQSLAEVQDAPATIEVFRTEKEAREWLGLDGE
jgi:hypothetical protein